MLVYDQPINQVKLGRGAALRRSAGFDLFELSRLLWRRKAIIAGVALICACAAVAIGKSLTPRYTATAELYVDPRELQLVDRELTPRAQDVSGLSMVVESQARLITSNSVLLRVIQNTNLDQDPEFGGESKGLLSSLPGLFGLQLRVSGQSKGGPTAALDALNRHITIRKTERSFVVDVEIWSRDPDKAAMLANALANAYLAESKASQASAARRATIDLSGRLKELQERLRNAETVLAAYRAQNNFVGTQDTLLSDQQLSASNQRLAAAHALALDAQAKYDQIEASRRTATDPGAIPEALQSATIANLRAQYAEARKRYAELGAELGPLHPTLRQMEKQVDDLRDTIKEEVDRFAQAAKNDLTRARDFEASLNKALELQKRQSLQLSQAAVRLRELEREVDASRDVYQAFLKRSHETEEQESLNTSAARIIGEATVPLHRSFPPGMSVLAMLGLLLGTLAAAGWVVAMECPPPETDSPEPAGTNTRVSAPKPKPATERPPPETGGPELAGTDTRVSEPKPATEQPTAQAAVPAQTEKPPIARLRESDVIRTLSGILPASGAVDVTRFGWPTLRPGFPLTTLQNALRDMRAAVARRAPDNAMPVTALIGAGEGEARGVAALNFALAAARDGARVLMIDADHEAHKLSSRVNRQGKRDAGRLGWLSIGSKASRAVKTANGISILPSVKGASEAIRKAIAQARSAGDYDLVILDGPALPWTAADRKLIDLADGLVAVLPVSLDINDSMEDIIGALDAAQRKLAGVIINELSHCSAGRQRGQQYA